MLASRLPKILIHEPEQFARTETMYVVTRLLQVFDQIENLEPYGAPLKMHHSIENRSGTGVQVRLHAAAAAVPGCVSATAEKEGAVNDLDLGLGVERRRESVGEQ